MDSTSADAAEVVSNTQAETGLRRADARRNREIVLIAASDAFVESGVNVPVRDVAARAGVGVGTVYRHFPQRADLIVAVYRHQVETCARVGENLLRGNLPPVLALREWMAEFVRFLSTKHGLPEALLSGEESVDSLHAYFVGRLVPIGQSLLEAASGEVRDDVSAFELMRGVGNLCIGTGDDASYDAHRLVEMLLDGLVARAD